MEQPSSSLRSSSSSFMLVLQDGIYGIVVGAAVYILCWGRAEDDFGPKPAFMVEDVVMASCNVAEGMEGVEWQRGRAVVLVLMIE